jgi:copper transport protein
MELTAAAGAYNAVLSLSPGKAGRNTLSVRFLHLGQHPVEPMEATLELSNPQAGIEPITRKLELRGDSFVHTGGELSVPGVWRIRISALISDFEKVTFDMETPVR